MAPYRGAKKGNGTMSKIFGFIGVGNMGGALARAACRSAGAENVLVADLMHEKAEVLAASCGCRAVETAEIAEHADYLFLGAKPQVLGALLEGIRPALAVRESRFVLVSMAAGVAVSRIEELAGAPYPIIRIMPNIPASVGEGMILYTANAQVTETELSAFTEGMCGAGLLDRIDEKLIDAASAISGCGPAFVYLFIEALADGGVACGLPYDKALQYAAQTVAGSARMVLSEDRHPEALKNAVCSPGGTTIAGVHALESGAFRALAMDAVCAAYRKTLELGKS